MRRLTRAALALSGALALALPAASASATAPTSTSAGSVSVNTGGGWTQDPSNPLFDFSRIVPGWKGTSALGVRNDSSAGAALSVKATNVVDDENGCNHPESFVDTTCSGADAGELGHEMVFTVASEVDPNTSLWQGSLYALEQGVALDADVAPGQADEFVVMAELPYSTGNETQTDSVTFDLVVDLDGATVAVEGTKTTRASGPGALHQAIDKLPFTGTPAERLVAAALCLLLLGSAVSLLARRRTAPGVL